MTLYFSKRRGNVEIRFSNNYDDMRNKDRPIADVGIHLNRNQLNSLMKFLKDNDVIDRMPTVNEIDDKSSFDSEKSVREKIRPKYEILDGDAESHFEKPKFLLNGDLVDENNHFTYLKEQQCK